jgi:hypothetical protein
MIYAVKFAIVMFHYITATDTLSLIEYISLLYGLGIIIQPKMALVFASVGNCP